MDGSTWRRSEQRISELCGRGLDLPSLWEGCTEALAAAVPHSFAPCWYTLDPCSLLVTSHHQRDLPELPAEWLAQEYHGDDVNKLADVARSAAGVATLHDATGGDPTSSPRWHENMRYGGDQEVIAGLRSASGEVWGALGLYREPGRPLFDAAELAFLRAVAPHLAEGARRGLLVGQAKDPEEGHDAPGIVVLRGDWSIGSLTPAAEVWLGDLPDGDLAAGRLPSSVHAVAGLARRAAEEPGAAVTDAVSRVRTRSGRWLTLHGAVLAPDDARRTAVIIEPAHPARIAPLLMAAYQLTEREKDVTRLVLHGRSTGEIAEELAVSPYTVQEHLKHVFDKTGVRTRRDLVGTVFFALYEPRVRDNERRASRQQPLRGEPLPVEIITSG